jgi:hypothetical protein
MRALAFLVSFLLAFLLFAVQPMATKMVLPTLGGTPAVWNTAMFTFQFLLLAGYAYAHGLAAHVAPRWQWRIHALLILVSASVLPLAVTLSTSEAMLNDPIPYLVAAFVMQLGLPFLVLAATQPLLQSWVSRSAQPLSETPYVLYSASNLGSFAGLIGYVVLAEPLLALPQQSMAWSVLYGIGMLLLLVLGYRLKPSSSHSLRGYMDARGKREHDEKAGWKNYALWIGLAFLPSSLSLGVTTYITTDIASMPLLWVIPLALYLLSFVDAFRTRPVLVKACQRIAPILGLGALILYGLQGHRFIWSFPIHLLSFAVMALAIHGWLAAYKPGPVQLTRFYLCLSFGGALGGLLNGLVAPLLFREALEYPLVLLAASLVAFLLQQGGVRQQLMLLARVLLFVLAATVVLYGLLSMAGIGTVENFGVVNESILMSAACMAAMLSLLVFRRYAAAVYACMAMVLVMLAAMSAGVAGFKTLYKDRNFFGVERIYENPAIKARYMMHDTTLHGIESLEPGQAMRPLSYYVVLGELFSRLPAMHAHPLAIVGLGIGNVKCYAGRQQKVDIYEINPLVKQLAEDTRYFHQLRDCPGDYQVLLGDGRIRLAQQPDGKYGAIVLDAFSSDAVPAHLLTHEALEMYLSKLAPGGVLLFNTTNRHIDLWPLLGAHADALGVAAYGKFLPKAPEDKLTFSAFWVVMAKSPKDVARVTGDESWKPLHGEGNRPWTDQYTNILPYFKIFR